MENEQLINYILQQAEDIRLNDKDDYTRELFQIAKDNNLWVNSVVGLAFMFSTNKDSCRDIESMLDCQERHVVDKFGNRINEFIGDELSYVSLLLENDIYNKYAEVSVC